LKFLHFKSSVFVTLIIIFFSGCVGSIIPQKNLSLPSWYLNAPVNNSMFIYGEGASTKSLSDAKTNGLNTMASKLVVSIDSTIYSSTKTSVNSYSKDVTKNIKVEVEKIKFTNAHLEKSAHVDNMFYVLMKVNRVELFNNKKREFDILDSHIQKKYKKSFSYSKLEQINILQNLYDKIKKAKQQAIVLNAINNDFNYTKYINQYDSYVNKIDTIKENLVIKIKSNNRKKYFADAFINILNQKQYRVSYNKNSDITISLRNKVRYSIARGWNIAKVTTTISISSNNKTISNTIINSIGRSSTSKESALENASQDFGEQIEEKTLNKVIFNK